MQNWLNTNLPEHDYKINIRTIRVMYSDCFGSSSLNNYKKGGATHPDGEDYIYDGWEIDFKSEEHAIWFKLSFQDETRELTTY